jgi:nicotinate-nucleotide adenylyltransferase
MSVSTSIALYGGSFDPPHMGHLNTIKFLMEMKTVDEVWLVPAGQHRDKDYYASKEQRLVMLNSMLDSELKSYDGVKIEQSQMEGPVATTYALWLNMSKCYPCYLFYFVIGTDLLKDLRSWSEADKLLVEASFLVMPRLGEVYEEGDLPLRYMMLDVPKEICTDVSSSGLRHCLAQGRSVAGKVPKSVENYLFTHQIYF